MAGNFTLDQYWKNFDLGKELHFAGAFIFNGLRTFHELKNFYHEDPVFEFLYALSVGIERLQKVAIILTEHDKVDDHQAFEESLITHSHTKLADMLEKSAGVSLTSQQKEFLSILAKFYKTHRYSRYMVSQTANSQNERELLTAFLEKHLNVKIDNDAIFVTQNDNRFRRFVGRIVHKICVPLYEQIQQEARRLNLYTYEIRYGSKAFKIFTMEKFDFLDDEVLTREILLYFVATKNRGSNSKLMADSDPLPFDPALEGEYIRALSSDEKKIYIMEELESLYEDHIDDFKERMGLLNAIGSEHLYLSGPDDEDPEDDFDLDDL